METKYSIDLFLLNKFQSVSDLSQDHFGFNNFAIAKFLRILMIISFISREVLAFAKGWEGSEIVVITCSLLVIINIEFILNKAEQSVKNNPAFTNPAVSKYALSRTIMQFVVVVTFALLIKHLYYILNPPGTSGELYYQWKEFFWDLFGVLIFFVSYFISCTPKPYKPSKAKKFIEQTSDRIRQSTVSPSPMTAFHTHKISWFQAYSPQYYRK